jgi:hypothetical protein
MPAREGFWSPQSQLRAWDQFPPTKDANYTNQKNLIISSLSLNFVSFRVFSGSKVQTDRLKSPSCLSIVVDHLRRRFVQFDLITHFLDF